MSGAVAERTLQFEHHQAILIAIDTLTEPLCLLRCVSVGATTKRYNANINCN